MLDAFFTTQNLIRSKQRKGDLKKSLESTQSKVWTFQNCCGIVLAMEVRAWERLSRMLYNANCAERLLNLPIDIISWRVSVGLAL